MPNLSQEDWLCLNIIRWILLNSPAQRPILKTPFYVFSTIRHLLMFQSVRLSRWHLHIQLPLKQFGGKNNGGSIIFTTRLFEKKLILLAISLQMEAYSAIFQSNFWIIKKSDLTIFLMLQAIKHIYLVSDFLRCHQRKPPKNRHAFNN